MLTKAEPTFDAAGVIQSGIDIFVQISHTTNYSGFSWLKRHLGDRYRVHALNIEDPYVKHTDASFVPLKPGIWFANPEKPVQKADTIRKSGWDITEVPEPLKMENDNYSSKWLAMNTLNLDEERIIVNSKEEVTICFSRSLA